MSWDNSLFTFDVGYYEFLPGRWLPGTYVPGGGVRWDRESVRKAVEVPIHDSDTLIATYPKNGQTWTMTIIHCLLQKEKLLRGEELKLSDFYKYIPFMEAEFYGESGAEQFMQLEPPRFMKSHLPYELLKTQLEKHPDLKVIQVIRNPKDCLVSYYHHIRANDDMGGFKGSWDQFFELYKEKKLGWGDYFEVNVAWYKFNKDRERSLVLRYEDMKKDVKSNIRKIAEFTGHQVSDELVDIIAQKSSVESAGSQLNKMYDVFPTWDTKKANFVRKGVVGDWKNYFSTEQSEFVEEETRKYLEPLGLKFEYSL